MFWRGLGTNYEFGVLENPARTAIHMSHRLLAILVAVCWLFLLLRILVAKGVTQVLRGVAAITLLLLIGQLSLGISNIVLHLPTGIAVLHNSGGSIIVAQCNNAGLLFWPP